MKPIPTEDELWRTWLEFLARYGTVEADPEAGATVTVDGRASLFRMSRPALHDYVIDFVGWRRAHGYSDGLGDGLPLPLMDSFGDCFGPQLAVHAEYALEGLDFRHVPGSSPEVSLPEVEGTAGLRGTWFLATGPEAAEREDEGEASAT